MLFGWFTQSPFLRTIATIDEPAMPVGSGYMRVERPLRRFDPHARQVKRHEVLRGRRAGRLWRDREALWRFIRLGSVALGGEDAANTPLDGQLEWLLRQSIMMVIGGGAAEIQKGIIAAQWRPR